MATDNRRAKKVWKRMAQIYGARFGEQFGEDPNEAWTDAINLLSDAQIAYGIRKLTRDTPIHPPALGQFEAACNDMPVAQATDGGPTIQEQLCAYIAVKYFSRLTPRQFRAPAIYLYRTGIDSDRPKHLQRTAECVGVVIEPEGESPGHRIMVDDMRADTDGYNRALRQFRPGAGPKKLSADEPVPF